MIRICPSISRILGTLSLLLCTVLLVIASADAQSVSHEFTGPITILGQERTATIYLTTTRLVKGNERDSEPLGYSIDGSISYIGAYRETPADERFYYSFYGASAPYYNGDGDSNEFVLTVEDWHETDSTVVKTPIGTIRCRFDARGNLVGGWESDDGEITDRFALRRTRAEHIYSSDSTTVFSAEFVTFWKAFVDAVVNNDVDALREMIHYPMMSVDCTCWKEGMWEEGYVQPVLTHENFPEYAACLFDDAARENFPMEHAFQLGCSTYSPDTWYGGTLPVPAGSTTYHFSYNPESEFTLMFVFARVNGAYKLVELGCAG